VSAAFGMVYGLNFVVSSYMAYRCGAWHRNDAPTH
jgi:hypothetical protein